MCRASSLAIDHLHQGARRPPGTQRTQGGRLALLAGWPSSRLAYHIQALLANVQGAGACQHPLI